MQNSPQTKSLMETTDWLLLPEPKAVDFLPPRAKSEYMVLGKLCGFDAEGRALVHWQGLHADVPQPAHSVVPLGQHDLDRQVVLAFVTIEQTLQPMIMGLVQKPAPLPATHSAPTLGWDVESDGKRMVLSAQEEITLRCGKASITLTKAGKVLLQGAYLLSRSSGVNRIKGGSVQIN